MHLITGGSGYLGIALARQLVNDGQKTRVYDLKRSPLLPGDSEFIGGDIRDADAVAAACEGATRVYHLAALIPQRKASRAVCRAVHVHGTRHVLDGCVKHGVERVVFLSSSEVYGHMEMTPCPETAPPAPLNEYGRNKVECEAMCAEYGKAHDLKIAILRPPTLIGTGITDDGILLMLKALERGSVFPIIGNGENRVHALDVDDCAAVVRLCAEEPRAVGGTFNVGCAGVPSLYEIAVGMKKIAHSSVIVLRVPAALGIGILRVLSILGISPIMPDHFELMTGDFVLDTSKIKNELGWVPSKTYFQSAEAMYNWYIKERSRS